MVDHKKGSKILAADNKLPLEDFVHMVVEDYKVDDRVYEVELSYMFPKKVLLTLPQNTPPVKIETCRQFHGFLVQVKAERVQLCVEIKEKKRSEDACLPKKESANTEEGIIDVENQDEDDDEDDERFDYCDDSDGATSGDEDYSLYGTSVKEEEDKQKTPETKTSSTAAYAQAKGVDEHVKLELSSLNLAVGQRYESKKALETRLKILSVVHRFDFKVDRSRPKLLTIKCWVEGCSWRVRATPVGDSHEFTIRVYVAEHSCSVTERSARARQATPAILGVMYMDSVGGVDSKVLPRHVAEALNMRFGIKVCR